MSGNQRPIGDDDLQAYTDDRLSGDRLALMTAYLDEHPEFKQQIAADRRIRDVLRAQLAAKATEPIPTRLRIANIRAARRSLWAGRWRAIAAALVLFGAGGTSGWLLAQIQHPPASQPSSDFARTASVAKDATAAYRTFVVEVAHPVEVDAAHEGHLLQWLSKRLHHPLAAPDLSSFGYHLMGGRLLPADSTAAAQLMFENAEGKRLTVYVQAANGTETAFRYGRIGDAATFAWIDRGFGFAVTAAEDRDRLTPIAEAVYRSFAPDESALPRIEN